MHRAQLLFALAALVAGLAGCRPGVKAPPEPLSINISVPYEVDSFDPHATVTVSNFAVLSNFYEPLARTDSEMKVQPCLARSWESPDPQTWIFELEPAARFHSGRPLTAADVEYSLNRLMTHPELRMRGFLPHISEVKALSRTTIRIRTAHPVVVFVNKLNFALIVPRGSTPESLAQNIDGTGPYRMNGWKKDEFMRLVRNEDYWGTEPEIRDVMLWLNRSPEEALQDLVHGNSQLVQSNTKKLEHVVRSMAGYEVLSHSSLFVKLLGFDVTREASPYCSVKPNPFRNPLVRLAIQLALNRADLISRISTQAAQATQPVPAFIFGFDPAIPHPAFDPAGARALLRKVNLPNGFQVTLHTRNILKETAEIVREHLRAIGIQVKVQALSDEEFFPLLNRREPAFYLTRWGCPSGDASDILDDVVHSANGQELGGNNWSSFKDREIDRIIEETSTIQTTEERQLKLQEAMRLLMKRLPLIPLYSDVDTYALDKRFSWEPRNDSYILAQEISLRKQRPN